MEIHKLLKSAAPAGLPWERRLAVARSAIAALAAGLHHSGEEQSNALTRCAENDECLADLVLVPAARAYSVREIASQMAQLGLCVARFEPKWRYTLEYMGSGPVMPAGGGDFAGRVSELDSASLADQIFNAAPNHGWLAREAGTGETSGVCDVAPVDPDLVPLFMLDGLREKTERLLRVDAAGGQRLDEAMKRVIPNKFGRIAWSPPGVYAPSVQARVEAMLASLPPGAPDLVHALDECNTLAAAAREVGLPLPDAIRTFQVLEELFGLRAASRDGGLPFCQRTSREGGGHVQPDRAAEL